MSTNKSQGNTKGKGDGEKAGEKAGGLLNDKDPNQNSDDLYTPPLYAPPDAPSDHGDGGNTLPGSDKEGKKKTGKVKTIPMTFTANDDGAKQRKADVHPNEVVNYKKAGWKVKGD